MNEVSRAPQSATGTTRHAVVPLLRPVDAPTEKLTVVGPRPAAPTQRLTARPFAWPEDGEADAPIDAALGAYGTGGSAA